MAIDRCPQPAARLMFIPPSRSQCRIWWTALTGLSLAVIAALVVGSVILAGQVLSYLQPVLVPVAVAGILAYLLNPVVGWIEARGPSRNRAIILLFSAGVLILGGIGLLVIPDLIIQAQKLYINRGEIFERAHEAIDRGLAPFGLSLEPTEATTGIIDWFKDDENLAAIGSFVMSQLSGVIGLVGYLFGIVLIPIYLFVFLQQSSAIARSWTDYIPLRASRFKDEIVETLTEFNQYLIAFFRGQLLVSIIDGVLTGIALAIMGLPYAVVIGFALATIGVIPYLGIILTYVPALLIAIAHFENWQGPVAVTLVFFAIQQIDGLLIQPRIVGDSVGLHPVTVIFSVLFWSLILGLLLGALLAVPLTASVKVLFRRYIWRRSQSRPAPDDDGGQEKQPAPG